MVLPTWTAVEASTVKTSREVWDSIKAEGWPVEVGVSLLCFDHAYDPST